MTTLLSFHNDHAVKQKYVDRLTEHRRLEHLTQGVGFERNGTTKGCAVGCTLDAYDHSRYPVELGLPEWLARLEDFLFEQLPKAEAEQFAVDLFAVIPVGVDVEPVRHKLGAWRIELALVRLDGNKEPYAQECRNALNLVKSWHLSQISGPAESAHIKAEATVLLQFLAES